VRTDRAVVVHLARDVVGDVAERLERPRVRSEAWKIALRAESSFRARRGEQEVADLDKLAARQDTLKLEPFQQGPDVG